ncbi:MAG TPA: DUF305 domain-containing protein [Longimicrobium sp.]|nr:DUF305 domain-containing protein [Longimicrobium sp.]
MTPSRTRSLAAALLAAVAAFGAAPAAAQAGGHSHSHTHDAPLPASAQGYRWTAADAHFMTTMIGHHAQAIVMSRLAPTRAANPQVRTLAERIINAQQDEIATMQQWLRDRKQPVPEVSHGGTVSMAAGAMQHHEHMPGMLTEAQLAQLAQARGAEFDRLFLTYMIQHHSGAVSMVEKLFGSWGAGQDEAVFKFASDVNVDQATEIARMQRMLAAVVFGAPAP